MSTAIKTMDETKLAEEIVSVVDGRVARVCSDDRDNVRFAVRGPMKLRSVVLGRAALRRLLHVVYPRRSAISPMHEQTAAVLAV